MARSESCQVRHLSHVSSKTQILLRVTKPSAPRLSKLIKISHWLDVACSHLFPTTEPANTLNQDPLPPEQRPSPNDETVQFHGWRLLGVIFVVCVALAAIAAAVDWAVIGPIEGRAF